MAVQYQRLLAYDSGDLRVSYGARECIVYALGIGIGMDPMDREQLKFVHERWMEAFPTMVGVLGWIGRTFSTDPQYGIDERRVVAAAQAIELHRPLAPEATLIARTRVKDVIDKGPGGAAIIVAERTLRTESGEVVAVIQNTSFARGQGGFGGASTASSTVPKAPQGEPQLTCDLATPPNLALIYRLNGDENPLHVDPERARVAGFARPILHGLATYGVAAHALLRTVAGYKVERFHAMQARFVKPVFPGDTIRTEMWQQGEEVAFRCRVPSRGEIVLDNGLARIG